MRIQGNLATYEFSDLLQWLAQGSKTGVLTVTDGRVEYQLGFDHGRVDMSSSSDPTQRLDSYLHRKGVIDDETLGRAERLRDATKMMSGQVLVTLGVVSPEQLAEALRQKTEEILCELLTWDRGTFDFAGGERPESPMVPISLEVTSLLLESMHRLDQERGGDTPPAQVEPIASFSVDEPAGQSPAAGQASEAIQANEGLALAEVLDPEPVTPSAADPPVPDAPLPVEELPPPYAVMTQTPGPIRRYAPYALVMALSLTAGGFYLVDKRADAETARPTGEPVIFTRTEGPPPSAPPSRSAPTPSLAATAPPPVPSSDRGAEEEALRRRYESQIAGLRQELEEARRLARPSLRSSGPSPGAGDGELPPNAIVRATASRPPEVQPAPEASPSAAGQGLSVRRDPAPLPRPATEPEPQAEPQSERQSVPTEAPPVGSVPPPAATRAEEPPVAPLELVRPTLLSRPSPRYPLAAQRQRRGASVTLRVLVGVDGRVEELERVGEKAGLGFDRAAETAAMASTWSPGTRNGEPIPMWAEVRFDFKP